MNTFKALLLKKLGPLPVWIYFLVGVVGIAWFIRKRSKDSGTEEATGTDQSAALSNMAFPDAQPMNYSSDIYINIPAPVVSGGTTTIPRTQHPLPRRPAPSLPATFRNLTRREAPQNTGVVLPSTRTRSLTTVVSRSDPLWSVVQQTLSDGSSSIENAIGTHSYLYSGTRRVAPSG